jgi:hypothetical protein
VHVAPKGCCAQLDASRRGMPCPVIDEKDKEVVTKGLTMQFRQTTVYQKMVADILHLSPNASSFEIDTAIWWFMAYPDMFESEQGISLIDAMEKRVNHNIGPGYKDLENDVNDYVIPECERQPVRDDTRIHAAESSDSNCNIDYSIPECWRNAHGLFDSKT